MAPCIHVIYACYENMLEKQLASCSFATSNFAERLYIMSFCSLWPMYIRLRCI